MCVRERENVCTPFLPSSLPPSCFTPSLTHTQTHTHTNSAWEKQEKMLKNLKAQGQSKSKAEQTAKASRSRETGGAKKKKADAVATGQEAAEVKELIERPREYTVTLEFPDVLPLSPPVVEVKDVSFKYGSNPWIFEDLNFGIDLESRVCIVGPNGSGKSTLLKLVTGALEVGVCRCVCVCVCMCKRRKEGRKKEMKMIHLYSHSHSHIYIYTHPHTHSQPAAKSAATSACAWASTTSILSTACRWRRRLWSTSGASFPRRRIRV